MTICHYYQRGTCKFGDRCKNEHPGSQRDGGNAFGGGNRGGFNAFNGGDRYRPSGGGTFGGNRSEGPRFHLSKEDIKTDLSSQRPIYPFSCYGPGRDAPRQLMEGPVEISPEELRLRFYSQRASGNESVAQQEETQLYSKTEEQVKSILNNLDGAIKYVEDGAEVHPNRIDISEGKVTPTASANSGPAANSNPFLNAAGNTLGGNQNSAPANPFSGGGQAQNSMFGKPANPFGQTSALGQTSSAFGQTSALGSGAGFGKPSMPGSAFGQASALGGGSTFGKPAALGGGAASAFGQTSSLGQGSAFGQPSAPGTTSAFGQPSAPGSTPAFGQASAAGATPAFGKPAFGQASTPSQPSTFGQASAPGQTSTFGQASAPGQTSTFGQASAPGQTSTFGQTNPLGQNNAFGAKPAFGQSTFGQPSQPAAAAANPFAQANQSRPQPSPAANPFTANSQPQTTPAPANPFAANAQAASAASTFGQPSGLAGSSAFTTAGQTSTATPKANPFTTAAQAFGAPTQPAMGQPSAAQAGQAAPATADPYKEGRPDEYEGEQGQRLMAIYQRVAQTGVFDPNEEIPFVPPKSEWVVPIELAAAPAAAR